MVLSKADLAKYPFTVEAARYVKDRDLRIEDLASRDYTGIVDRARERVEEAVLYGIVGWDETPNYDVEILSFPVSIVIVLSTESSFLGKRYALAESKKAYNLLRAEKEDKKLVEISSSFNWDVKTAAETTCQAYDFALSFIDYLKNAPDFHDYKWKLVNRYMADGRVFLMKYELARLIAEEARKHIQRRLVGRIRAELPPTLTQAVSSIRRLISAHREIVQAGETPRVMIEEAYPPCIRALNENLLSNRNISHIGRFTLTSFLLNIGVSVKDVVKLFTSATDFDENLTRYQVEHIAGKRGSGTKYTPPNCETLRTHGLCPGMDDLCKRVKHPLTYYRRKLRQTKAGRVAVESG